jgi:HSP20 family molecular chaperone IbpA
MDDQGTVATTTSERPLRLRLIPPELLAYRVKSLRKTISDRAFEIFRGRKWDEGDALSDWHRAEGELFHAAHVDISERGDALLVRTEVPGFEPRDLQVCVGPDRLVIAGKRRTQSGWETRNVLYSDSCLDRIFRVLALPFELDASKATAAVSNGILELAIPKRMVPSGVRIIEKTDWIVRADDYRSWNEVLEVHKVSNTP